MKKVIFTTVSLLLCLLLLQSCGKKADETKAVSDVRTETAKMDVNELRKMAMTYKDAVVAKTDELGKIKEKLASVSLADILGDEAKELNAEVETLSRSVMELKERYQVYYDAVKEQGGDVSDLAI